MHLTFTESNTTWYGGGRDSKKPNSETTSRRESRLWHKCCLCGCVFEMWEHGTSEWLGNLSLMWRRRKQTGTAIKNVLNHYNPAAMNITFSKTSKLKHESQSHRKCNRHRRIKCPTSKHYAKNAIPPPPPPLPHLHSFWGPNMSSSWKQQEHLQTEVNCCPTVIIYLVLPVIIAVQWFW